MAASVEPVVVDEIVRVRLLRPASRGLVELVGEHADGEGDGDVLGVEEVRLVLPVEAGRGDPGVGQPVEGDVVQDVVSGEVALGVALAEPLRLVRAGRCRHRDRLRMRRDRSAESASPYNVCGRVDMIHARTPTWVA